MSDKLIEAVARGLDAEFPLDWDNIPPEEMARAAIAAVEAAGYRVVPVVATEEMLIAGSDNTDTNATRDQCARSYAAMLAAAPKVGE